jgi:hypothetical protein
MKNETALLSISKKVSNGSYGFTITLKNSPEDNTITREIMLGADPKIPNMGDSRTEAVRYDNLKNRIKTAFQEIFDHVSKANENSQSIIYECTFSDKYAIKGSVAKARVATETFKVLTLPMTEEECQLFLYFLPYTF